MAESRAARPFSVTVPGLIATLLVFAVAAVCIRLGFWQLERLEQRKARTEPLAVNLEAPPFRLSSALNDTSGLRFRHAHAAGTWDGERSIVLPGRSLRGVPGVHVLTPLVLDGGAAVLVNRGWVAAPDGATVNDVFFVERGRAEVSGLIVPFPGAEASRVPTASLGTDSGFRRVWFAIDEAALRAQFPYRLLDVQLQLLADTTAPAWPVRLPPPVIEFGPHLGYALQWFSFALIALGGWTAMVLRARASRPRPAGTTGSDT
jgi:surfeit locus 1 family protein